MNSRYMYLCSSYISLLHTLIVSKVNLLPKCTYKLFTAKINNKSAQVSVSPTVDTITVIFLPTVQH